MTRLSGLVWIELPVYGKDSKEKLEWYGKKKEMKSYF